MRPIYSTLASKTRGLCPVGYSSAISLLPTRLAPFDGGSHASRGGSCSALRECSQNTDDCSSNGGTASPGQCAAIQVGTVGLSQQFVGRLTSRCYAYADGTPQHCYTAQYDPVGASKASPPPPKQTRSRTTHSNVLLKSSPPPSDGLPYQQLFLYSGVGDSIGAVAAVVKKAPTSPPSPVPRGRRDSRSG